MALRAAGGRVTAKAASCLHVDKGSEFRFRVRVQDEGSRLGSGLGLRV